MITLLADRPTPAYAAELEQFGRLAGLWETRISYYPADGSPSRHADGDWEFGYALDGRAVIDVWQVPGRRALAGAARSADQEHGLCVRIWDPRLRLWRFTFHGTARGDLVHMFAREVDDEIVMERADGAALVRWTFSDIRAESFEWRSERSGDGGRSWRLEQEVRGRRADTVPGAHRDELAGALLAPAPGVSLGDEARLFDRLSGCTRRPIRSSHSKAERSASASFSTERSRTGRYGAGRSTTSSRTRSPGAASTPTTAAAPGTWRPSTT